MFKQVSLSNFKSIRDGILIDLGELTVVTGSNSSGKSSVLQSLLLLAQTLRYAGEDRQLVLNGPLARLGEFSDVFNSSGASSQLGIGVVISPPEQADRIPTTPQGILRRTTRPTTVSVGWTFTDKSTRGDQAPESGRTFPTVNTMTLKSESDALEVASVSTLTVRRHPWKPDRRFSHEGYASEGSDRLKTSLAWSVEHDAANANAATGNLVPDVRGVIFDHCFPSEFTGRIDVHQLIAQLTLDALARPTRAAPLDDFEINETLWTVILELVFGESEARSPGSLGAAPRIDSVREWINGLPRAERNRAIERLRERRAAVLRRYRTAHSPEYWLRPEELPDVFKVSIRLVRRELAAVRYLGPLRVQPAPLYPVASSLGSDDVGPSGEWTASVLDTYREQQVTFPLPPSGGEMNVEDTRRKSTAPLGDAVDLWMRYLGVSGNVITADRGSLGHSLNVRTETSDRPLPLTHVGVGVSQCLPVVVSLLLAGDDSMTLLEQPELHLHPAVQSRLADFLLAMSLSGRQCVVETHSEYLVNRLRLRIAQSQGGDVRSAIRMYFASIQDGASQFEEVSINEHGSISNWPRGFFDESQDDIEEMLRASLAKRGREARNAGSS